MQRREASQANWLPDRKGQGTGDKLLRKERRLNCWGIHRGLYRTPHIVTVSNNRGFMETNRKISKTEQGSCMSGLGVWVRVTINKVRIPDAKGWPFITNRYSRYLDTSILRYIDTFNAKTGSSGLRHKLLGTLLNSSILFLFLVVQIWVGKYGNILQ